MAELFKRQVYDNIHGHITLNRVEARILDTPYYQRLRWIRQLGFSFYVYPGATHTRHAHALGVLHVMHRILTSIGKASPDEKFFNPASRYETTQFNRMMRLAAMLHDVGTFPFSHTIELAYINHWKEQQRSKSNKSEANHEVLGQHIILNTDFEGGITKILKEEGIDPVELSTVISGRSKNVLSNQLMHSDVDADRMDYLLRDAHFTGIKLGVYDIDFLIRALTVEKVKGQEVLCVREDAMNVVDSFLVSRYFWYSQIISDGTSYKFDLIAAKIHQYFLENGLAYSFDHLKDKVSQNPNEYFTFNDSYFLAKLHEYLAGRITHPMIRELSEMLANRIAPAQIKAGPVKPTLIQSDEHRKDVIRQVNAAHDWLKAQLSEIDPTAWMIFDIPTKDVTFTKNLERVLLDTQRDGKVIDSHLLRDPAKILTREGEVKLLIEMPNSVLKILSQYRNFLPRIYVSPSTLAKLEAKGVIEKMNSMQF
ncbi:MAG: HD domain-containing protein [Bdellovibrionota bacterium]